MSGFSRAPIAPFLGGKGLFNAGVIKKSKRGGEPSSCMRRRGQKKEEKNEENGKDRNVVSGVVRSDMERYHMMINQKDMCRGVNSILIIILSVADTAG